MHPISPAKKPEVEELQAVSCAAFQLTATTGQGFTHNTWTTSSLTPVPCPLTLTSTHFASAILN